MTHAFLYIPTNSGSAEVDGLSKGMQTFRQFKSLELTDTARSDVASVAVAPCQKAAEKHICRSGDGQLLIVDLGTWLPLPSMAGCDASWLIQQYQNLGVREMARKLQGFFVLLIIDLRLRQVHVVTDRCGSLHVFFRQLADGYAVCTSSAVLALCGEARFDPVAVHEFVATGIIYEDRSLWADVKKIGPATILTFDSSGTHTQKYWNFSEVAAESLSLDEAAEKTFHGLVEVLKGLPTGTQPLVSDLTGGYDSRLLLAGLLEAKHPFETTVSGNEGHPDVVVAGRLAREFGLRQQHIVAKQVPSPEEFEAALRITDGEYNVFEYSNIMLAHHALSKEHAMSLNGCFGELARGYWWELLWPRLAQRQPLDAEMVARRRFAAIGYDSSVFETTARLDLGAHMTEVVRRAIKPITDFPNTSQMDCVYYTLRMQRWQGRIASSTNQIWPAFSPIGLAQVLDPILAAKANTRIRSLLVRKLFARFSPTLSRIPLEHGYPPMPATPLNIWRFAPVLDHYGEKILSKVASRLKVGRKNPATAQPLQLEDTALFRETDMPGWIKAPVLLNTGLFRPEPLLSMLDPGGSKGGLHVEQWCRLITLEALARQIL